MNGTWHQGALRMWTQREDGTWCAYAQRRPNPGETYLGTLPAEDIRLDETEPRPAPGGGPEATEAPGAQRSRAPAA